MEKTAPKKCAACKSTSALKAGERVKKITTTSQAQEYSALLKTTVDINTELCNSCRLEALRNKAPESTTFKSTLASAVEVDVASSQEETSGKRITRSMNRTGARRRKTNEKYYIDKERSPSSSFPKTSTADQSSISNCCQGRRNLY